MSREALERVKRATVAIAWLNPHGSRHPITIMGSGFCIDKAGIVVTCRHVIEAFMSKTTHEQIADVPPEERGKPMERLRPVEGPVPHAVFYDSRSFRDRALAFPSRVDIMMAKTNHLDLGMLRLHPHTEFPNGYPTVEIEDYDALGEGDEIGVYGFPLGTMLTDALGTISSSFTRGSISSIIPAAGVDKQNIRGFQLDVTATNGNSGGPVFSLATGRVFGVLDSGPRDGSGRVVSGIARAQPVYPVLERGVLESFKAADRNVTLG